MKRQTVYEAMPEATEERITIARAKIYAAMNESKLPAAHAYTMLSVIRQRVFEEML